MIEIKNVLMPQQDVVGKHLSNYIFDNGVTYIEEFNKKLFKLLSLNYNILSDNSSFIINGKALDLENENADYLIMLKVNSSSIVLNCALLVNDGTKDDLLKSFKEELETLKPLNVESERDHTNKITKILDIVQKHNCSYVLLDFNDKTNKSNIDLITKVFNKLQFTLPVIILEKLENIKDEALLNKVSPKKIESDTKKEKKIKIMNKVVKNDESEDAKNYVSGFVSFKRMNLNQKFPANFGVFVKQNLRSFLFFVIPVLGFVSFFLLAPYYFAIKDATIGGILLFGAIVCMALFLISEFNLYSYLKHDDEKYKEEKYVYIAYLNLISLVIGFGLGIGLFYLIGAIDSKFAFSNYKFTMTLTGIIAFIVNACSILYMPFIVKFSKRFKKKK